MPVLSALPISEDYIWIDSFRNGLWVTVQDKHVLVHLSFAEKAVQYRGSVWVMQPAY